MYNRTPYSRDEMLDEERRQGRRTMHTLLTVMYDMMVAGICIYVLVTPDPQYIHLAAGGMMVAALGKMLGNLQTHHRE